MASAEGKSPSSTFQSTAPLLQGTITTQSAMFNLYYVLSLIKVFLLTGNTTNLHLNNAFKKDSHLMVKAWDPDQRPNAISCSWARSPSAKKTLTGCFTEADGHQDGEANSAFFKQHRQVNVHLNNLSTKFRRKRLILHSTFSMRFFLLPKRLIDVLKSSDIINIFLYSILIPTSPLQKG